MIRGRVIGHVWATKKAPRLADRKLLLVAEYTRGVAGIDRPSGRVVVAVDDLDADMGSEVIVAFGSGARNSADVPGRDVLSDAAVVQIIDGVSGRSAGV